MVGSVTQCSVPICHFEQRMCTHSIQKCDGFFHRPLRPVIGRSVAVLAMPGGGNGASARELLFAAPWTGDGWPSL